MGMSYSPIVFIFILVDVNALVAADYQLYVPKLLSIIIISVIATE